MRNKLCLLFSLKAKLLKRCETEVVILSTQYSGFKLSYLLALCCQGVCCYNDWRAEGGLLENNVSIIVVNCKILICQEIEEIIKTKKEEYKLAIAAFRVGHWSVIYFRSFCSVCTSHLFRSRPMSSSALVCFYILSLLIFWLAFHNSPLL